MSYFSLKCFFVQQKMLIILSLLNAFSAVIQPMQAQIATKAPIDKPLIARRAAPPKNIVAPNSIEPKPKPPTKPASEKIKAPTKPIIPPITETDTTNKKTRNQTKPNGLRISLLTMQPGTEVYSVFGHSAFRVQDTLKYTDYVYNYGTFNFETPYFYTKFVRGRLDYALSVSKMNDMVNNYIEENRSIYEQELDLSPEQVRRLDSLLRNNYLPQNRLYRYDFFFDNCATRIRDMLNKAIGENLSWQEEQTPEQTRTFRQLIAPYIAEKTWVDMGIQLILGSKTDRMANSIEQMFLPDYLKQAFTRAQISDSTKTKRPLVKQTKTLFEATPRQAKATWFTPNVLFAALLLLAIYATIKVWNRQQTMRVFDMILFAITGLFGCFLLLCWFATDHKVLVNNYNLLWAMPLNLPLAFILLQKQLSKWGKMSLLFPLLCLIIFLTGFWYLPQVAHTAFYLIATALLVRIFARLKSY